MLVREWIEQVRGMLLTGKQEGLDRLKADVGVGQEVIRIDGTFPSIQPGTMISVGLETMYVRASNTQPSDITDWPTFVAANQLVPKGTRVQEGGKLWVVAKDIDLPNWTPKQVGAVDLRTPTGADSAFWVEVGEFASGHGGVTCSVFRGVEGSEAGRHSAGEMVRIAPTWTDHRICEAVCAEIGAMSSPLSLYRVTQTQFPISARQRNDDTYLLDFRGKVDPDQVWKVLELNQRIEQYSERDWSTVTGPLELIRVETSDEDAPPQMVVPTFPDEPERRYEPYSVRDGKGEPTGKYRHLALRLRRARYAWDHRSVFRVQLATGLGMPTPADFEVGAEKDAQKVTGLASTALDIPVLGAAYRLMAPLPGRFVLPDAQDEPRRPGEVAGGSGQSAVTRLRQRYEERITAEARALRSRYGVIRPSK